MKPEPPEVERAKPAALQLGLPPSLLAGAGAPPTIAAPARSATPVVLRVAGVLVLLGAAGVATVDLAVPWFLRRACIDDAAARGISLKIDSVDVKLTGFVLGGVEATASGLPGVRLTAPNFEVQMSGLSPQRVSATGAELTISGTWSAVATEFERWLATQGGAQGGPGGQGTASSMPRSLVVDGSRVVWQGLAGDGASVQAAGLHLDASWQDDRPTWHTTSDLVTVSVPHGSLGPWRVDIDRSPGASRVRLALDPGVPDSSSIVVLGDDKATASVDVAIPRSPISRLGIAPSLLGLAGTDLQLAAAAHFVALGPRTTASSTGGIYGIRTAGLPRPIDVAWEGAASGDTGGALDVKQAKIAVGPLTGTARGTLKEFDDGFRLDLAWNAGPVPCAAFDAPIDEGRQFDLGYELRQLAQGIGIAKVSGTVSAHATLAFDSRDLGGTAVAFAPDVSCKVALFAAR